MKLELENGTSDVPCFRKAKTNPTIICGLGEN
jgi:hypothetical protein